MEKILEKARELGTLLSQSPEYLQMKQLEEAMSADPEFTELYAQYADLSDQLDMLEMDGQDSSQLEEQVQEIEHKLATQQGMRRVNEARAQFNAILNQVNRILQAQITGEELAEEDEDLEGGCGSPSGCEGCMGCGSR